MPFYERVEQPRKQCPLYLNLPSLFQWLQFRTEAFSNDEVLRRGSTENIGTRYIGCIICRKKTSLYNRVSATLTLA